MQEAINQPPELQGSKIGEYFFVGKGIPALLILKEMHHFCPKTYIFFAQKLFKNDYLVNIPI
jgi:hypothetical protein